MSRICGDCKADLDTISNEAHIAREIALGLLEKSDG